jgi:hypothetical protein
MIIVIVIMRYAIMQCYAMNVASGRQGEWYLRKKGHNAINARKQRPASM